ncbi:uncharacterized protein LOC131335809 [Rhododendron vialii]|uniref:uncharacterized protein LOC131335809 n=1 Tax=Rhododendron vialii TaxID=182163 RepID=UPI00265E233A|nr:uncharacterized protein LOC131335809 [Rhododendron vialii]
MYLGREKALRDHENRQLIQRFPCLEQIDSGDVSCCWATCMGALHTVLSQGCQLLGFWVFQTSFQPPFLDHLFRLRVPVELVLNSSTSSLCGCYDTHYEYPKHMYVSLRACRICRIQSELKQEFSINIQNSYKVKIIISRHS